MEAISASALENFYRMVLKDFVQITEKYITDSDKNTEKERFKNLREKKISELITLLTTNNLGKEPQQKLTTLMQIRSKVKWWKSENNFEKKKSLKNSKPFMPTKNGKRKDIQVQAICCSQRPDSHEGGHRRCAAGCLVSR